MDSKIYLSLNGEQELSFLSWKQCDTVAVCNICIFAFFLTYPPLPH